jgi:hypothetical protein
MVFDDVYTPDRYTVCCLISSSKDGWVWYMAYQILGRIPLYERALWCIWMVLKGRTLSDQLARTSFCLFLVEGLELLRVLRLDVVTNISSLLFTLLLQKAKAENFSRPSPYYDQSAACQRTRTRPLHWKGCVQQEDRRPRAPVRLTHHQTTTVTFLTGEGQSWGVIPGVREKRTASRVRFDRLDLLRRRYDRKDWKSLRPSCHLLGR